MKKYRLIHLNQSDELLKTSDYNTILYEGEAEDPFEELFKFKRRTFSDGSDPEWRMSPLRMKLKTLWNNGGKIAIEILPNK